jgi:hypothetical protein
LGPVNFYQTLGLVNASAFNKISLGNGYTAYLYNIAPSAVGTPSDYYLKPKVMKYINKTNAAGYITEASPVDDRLIISTEQEIAILVNKECLA